MAGAAARAVADAERDDAERARSVRVWRAAHDSAAFHWITLAAEADGRRAHPCLLYRAHLTEAVAAEGTRRAATLLRGLSAELSGLLETPQEPHFVRLHLLPGTREAQELYRAWITDRVERTLQQDAAWLHEAVLRNRPGAPDRSGPDVPRADEVVPAASLPGVARAAAAEEAEEAAAWDTSWLPEFVGTAIESVLSPIATDVVGQIAGAAGTALATEALEHGQAERRERTIQALRQVVESAFAEQAARTAEALGRTYAQLLQEARDRDGQWWRLHTAALTAAPDSAGHWRALRETAGSLRRTVRTRLAALEGE